MGTHAYSPDGHSLACASNSAIIIWDIQTGGVAKQIQLDASYDALLAWSLDGRKIWAMTWGGRSCFAVWRFDIVSGTMQSSTISHSRFKPHVWAHDKSFRAMTTRWCPGIGRVQDRIIDIFEADPTLTKIESFDVRLGRNVDYIGSPIKWHIGSFSPTAYRISVSIPSQRQVLVLDIRNSRTLLAETHPFGWHCFSPDGGFFAASQVSTVQIWKYDGSSYIAWRNLPTRADSRTNLLFSPTSSSVLGTFDNILKVWQLGDLFIPPIPAADSSAHFLALVLTSWLQATGGIPSRSPTSFREPFCSSSTRVSRYVGWGLLATFSWWRARKLLWHGC